MSDRLRAQWEHLGKLDPYWAVLTQEEFKTSKRDVAAFFATGENDILGIFREMEQRGIRPNLDTALDFGCGVGRISRALSARFETVIGTDVSEAMLEEARRVNSCFKNLKFVRNSPDRLDTVEPRTVDFVYTAIVLQHMPRDRQEVFLTSLCGALRPGGVMAFHTPSRRLYSNRVWAAVKWTARSIRSTWRRLTGSNRRHMEMHCLPRDRVEQLLNDSGLDLVDALPSTGCGAAYESFMYLAVKTK